MLGNHNFWHGGIHFSNVTVEHCIKSQAKRSWNNRYFILQEVRNVRDKATGLDNNTDKNLAITYKGELPNHSKIQVISLETTAEGKYTIAQVRIIAFGNKTTALPNKVGTTKEQKAQTKAVGDIVYIAVFDDKGNIGVNGKKQPYIKEYTPQQSWVGKTLVLDTDVKGSLSKPNLMAGIAFNTGTCEPEKILAP